MGLFKDYVSQTRKPEGFLGKMMLKGMNSGHAKLADWGLGHLQNIAPESIVDLGCGGGRNAGELLRRYPEAHVTAVDYSELSVEKAKGFDKTIDKAGANFRQDFTYESYREFFAGAGFVKICTNLIDGRVPCAVAVISKQGKSQ